MPFQIIVPTKLCSDNGSTRLFILFLFEEADCYQHYEILRSRSNQHIKPCAECLPFLLMTIPNHFYIFRHNHGWLIVVQLFLGANYGTIMQQISLTWTLMLPQWSVLSYTYMQLTYTDTHTHVPNVDRGTRKQKKICFGKYCFTQIISSHIVRSNNICFAAIIGS